MPRSEMIPRENFRVNDRIRAYLKDIVEENNQVSVILSRSCKEIIEAFFKLEVPEIAEEVIEIQAIAREPGQRTKVAVSSNDKRIDPRGSCIGIRGSRVQAISNEFSGEKIDVLVWSDDPVELVIDAMQPAEVLSIVMDEDTHSIDVIVEESQLSLAIGRGGQNVRLASKLTGWELNVLSQKAAEDREHGEHLETVSLFMSALELDEGLAQSLVDAGFTTLEEVAYVADEELLNIDGVDEAEVAKLQEAANGALLNQALSGEAVNTPQADLLSMEGITLELANKLAAIGVYSMEDLAEQSIDDLADIKDLTPEKAGELIMRARAPWFEGED
jgi:N utilization substance protein A